jgi:ribosome recycling factor
MDRLTEKMTKTLNALKGDLVKVRTGRASPALLDSVRVDYYGTPTPISQVATVTCPEPRLIQIQPWEANLIPAIEKGILLADLGLNPQNDGKIIRVPLPPLTEERRKDLVKQIKKQAEETRIALRNERRQANDEFKKLEKDGDITQDEHKKASELVQKKTDEFVAEVDKAVAAKEKEIMSV